MPKSRVQIRLRFSHKYRNWKGDTAYESTGRRMDYRGVYERSRSLSSTHLVLRKDGTMGRRNGWNRVGKGRETWGLCDCKRKERVF